MPKPDKSDAAPPDPPKAAVMPPGGAGAVAAAVKPPTPKENRPAPAPQPTLTATLERFANAAHHRGDFAEQALLQDIAVAAGALRRFTSAARGRLSPEVSDLIEELHSAL